VRIQTLYLVNAAEKRCLNRFESLRNWIYRWCCVLILPRLYREARGQLYDMLMDLHVRTDHASDRCQTFIAMRLNLTISRSSRTIYSSKSGLLLHAGVVVIVVAVVVVQSNILLSSTSLIRQVWMFCNRNQIDDDTFRFLLTGGVALDNPYPNPAPDWLADRAWSEIVRCSNLPGLSDYMDREFAIRRRCSFPSDLAHSKLACKHTRL